VTEFREPFPEEVAGVAARARARLEDGVSRDVESARRMADQVAGPFPSGASLRLWQLKSGKFERALARVCPSCGAGEGLPCVELPGGDLHIQRYGDA
jgi:hypothetical protein